jgi:hypothetical protein
MFSHECIVNYLHAQYTNSVALVREKTIPTERPPLVGEVNAKLLRIESVATSAQRIPYGRILVFRPKPLLFLPSSSSVVLTRLSGPRSRATTSQRNVVVPGIEPELWICSQEL